MAAYRLAWSLSAAVKRLCTSALEVTNRAYFSIFPIIRFSISHDTMDNKDRRSKMHLEQSRTDIRSHDKLDTLNFRLHEHNPDVFFVRRRRVTTKEVDGF